MKIHPTAIVEDGAALGDVEIGPYCQIGPSASLEDGVVLKSHVVIEGRTQIGAGTVVHPFSVLGGAPQHLQYKDEPTELVIGANNIIREHVTMNRGTASGGGVTHIGEGGFFMTGAHVAHDCTVGERVIFANNATLGGHVCVGSYAFLGGLCAIHQFSRIGEYAFVGGCAAVTSDIIPFGSAVGNHAKLVGLNLVGLKRRNFSREAIGNLRSAYKLLFSDQGVFRERIEVVRQEHGCCPYVVRVLEFVETSGSRALMTPERSGK